MRFRLIEYRTLRSMSLSYRNPFDVDTSLPQNGHFFSSFICLPIENEIVEHSSASFDAHLFIRNVLWWIFLFSLFFFASSWHIVFSHCVLWLNPKWFCSFSGPLLLQTQTMKNTPIFIGIFMSMIFFCCTMFYATPL